MKSLYLRQLYLLAGLLLLLSSSGCSDDFYLSEKEVQAYASTLATQQTANLTFDNLQGRTITIQFDNSTGTPRVQSTNLLVEMRRTELAQLESGPAAISLSRLNDELQRELSTWIENRLELYASSSNDSARLTHLDSVDVQFLNNPTFTYHPESQSIGFDSSVRLTINCTIQVNAVSWLVDLFTNINGTYPLTVLVTELRLQGEASLLSPYANAGRIQFRLTPQLVPGLVPPLQQAIAVLVTGNGVPDQVANGLAALLRHDLSQPVDEIFDQDYYQFALAHLGLSNATTQAPTSLEVTYRSKAGPHGPESTNPMLHIVSRATDGKLYHARKGDTGWSSYTPIPFPNPSPTPYPTINGDPSLVYSGAGQMELAATDENGDVVYAHWRDEAWGNFQFIKPNTNVAPTVRYRGRTALVASAPGAAEIVVVGTDGQLWHLRRLNGGFASPFLVPLTGNSLGLTAPYRDPIAVQVGNKFVVIFADQQSRLGAIAFDLETNLWGVPALFTTPALAPAFISFAPAAVASGDERVDVVYVDPSGVPKHRRLEIRTQNFVIGGGDTGINFPGTETIIGGKLNATPVLVAAAYRQLDLIGRVSGNRLRYNHFVEENAPFQNDGVTIGPGWQGWRDMIGNLSSSGTTTNELVTDFSATATRTGRVELAARAPLTQNATQAIFHNNFESGHHGLSPWKTMNWRGYQFSGLASASGRPAIAAADRNFQIGFIGRSALGNEFDYAELSASNETNFFLGLTARPSVFVPPVILSSGPTLVDYLYIGDDARLHHFRKYGDYGVPLRPQSFTIAIPNGVGLAGPLAADSYGNGFIDLAALGTDGCLYHWRFRGGAWSNAAGVACHIGSSPALLYTGAGHLELLAVDLDHRLYRWRNLGTSWNARLSISSTFNINEGLFSQTAASSWGDGTVDVAVVNKDTGRLYHRRIGPDDEICTLLFGCPAPRVFSNLGGNVTSSPIVTAFSPVNVSLLTRSGLQWYSNWASAEILQPITFPPARDPLLRWSGFQWIGSDISVAGAANAGRKNYAAIAIRDGRIFVNRFQDDRWTGFQPLAGQPSFSILSTPTILPTIAAHGG